MKKLPLGIQTFRKLIEEDYLYVDKTREIFALLNAGQYLFLSRPRRFGKSLLASTLKEVFLGSQHLFQGLFIYDKHDWQPAPVIHIDFSLVDYANDRLFEGILQTLDNLNAEYQLGVSPQGFKDYFYNLIRGLAKKSGNVVVLIDEYDKPIIDYVDNLAQARKNRDILRDFYLVLKGSDPYLRFVFLTGVSKFSRVSVFSGLNNLQDITLAPQFATIAGYTQAELEQTFGAYLQRFCEQEGCPPEELLGDIRRWYNGYSWNGQDRVYNPFSILSLFANRQFGNYWFATGTPTFLINLIKREQVETAEFENVRVPELTFDSYDLEHLNILALLFQTGYLTVTARSRTLEGIMFTLNYPNLEVKKAFLTYLLESFTTYRLDQIQVLAQELRQQLASENIAGFINTIRSLMAKIPYTLHLPQEAYYHSLFYMILALLGLELDLEVLTDKGRIDGVLELADQIYLIEFKYGQTGSDLDDLTNKAIRQIQAKHYPERFWHDPRRKLLLGVGFTAAKEIGYKVVGAREATAEAASR